MGGVTMATCEKITDYDDDPIKYCPRCLSIKVKYEESQDTEYCGDCGCTDIVECSFEEWEKKYERRYGHKFVEKSNDPRKSYIFNLTVEELKQKMYDSDNWKAAIVGMNHKFPGGYSKIDTILLFFDWLIKENKLDDFKILLTKIKL